MKRTRPLILLIFGLSLSYFSTGCLQLSDSQQDIDPYAELPIWREMMEEPDVDLDEAHRAFETYWRHHDHYRGDRSKQFERWYSFNSKRLDAAGWVISSAQVAAEFHRLRTELKVQQLGEWYNYGPIDVAPRKGIKIDGGRVNDVAFHPTDPDIFYVSCFQSGVFKTIDGGKNWEPVTDNLTDDVFITLVDPTDPGKLHIATDIGVKISTDGGLNWTNSGLPTQRTEMLVRKPDAVNTLLAGTEAGIFLSSDGGQNWTQVLTAFDVDDLIFHPTNAAIAYAGTNGGKFFRSADGGQTWTENTTDFTGSGAYVQLAVTPAAPDYVYAIRTKDDAGDDTFEGFYRSTDAGLTFTKQSSYSPGITGFSTSGAISRGQPNYALFVEADPVNADVVYAGGVHAWKSADGGQTWTDLLGTTTDGDRLHADQLNWSTNPLDQTIYALNDGGIYRLTTTGQFDQLADGLPLAESLWASQSRQNKSGVVGGTVHCGTKLNQNGVWITAGGGDDSMVFFDDTDDHYIYKVQYNSVRRSTDGGNNFSTILNGSFARGLYESTAFLDRNDPNIIYLGFEDVIRSNNVRDASPTFANISNFPNARDIIRVRQSLADGHTLYLSRTGSEFYRSDDLHSAMPTFVDLSANLPGGSANVTDIHTDPDDADVVYILQGTKIYKSSDSGVSWMDLSGSLPAISLHRMVADTTLDEAIYIGTDIGVFYKDATLSDWVDFSLGLPARKVNGMDIYYDTVREESVITISAFGRGFWRSPLYGVNVSAPVADFSADETTIIAGSKVKFTNLSTGAFTYEWDFAGGTPASSIDINPEVAYPNPGTYDVTLTATNSAGQDIAVKTAYITVAPPPSDPLQVHYQFEGDLEDSSPYGRDGSNLGTTAFGIGYKGTGQSYQFTGNNYVTVEGYTGVLGSAARTVAVWIKTGQANETISHWGGSGTGKKLTFKVDPAGKPRVEVAGGYIIGSTTLTDDNWHHVALTFENDGSPNVQDVRLYVDGSLETVSASLAQILDTGAGDDVLVGKDPFASPFLGLMDDFRIYDEALSASEITTLAYLPPAGLISFYPFNSNLQDLGSNNIPAQSNYGNPVYVEDNNGEDNSAWQAPGNTGEFLTIPGYRGLAGDHARTVSAWVKTNKSGTRRTILSWGINASGRMFNLMVLNGEVRVEGGASNVSTQNAKIGNNQWHHIAYTFDPADGGKLIDGKIYIDGTLHTNLTNFNGNVVLNTDAATNNVQIGNAVYTNNYNFIGDLNDVSIYDYALDAAAIQALYGGEPVVPAMQLRYPFEGNLEDYSEFQRHASTLGTTNYVEGPYGAGQAYGFDGNNQLQVTTYSGEAGTQDRTVAAWIKTGKNNGVIINWGTPAAGQKFTFKVHSDGRLRVEVAGGFVVGSMPVSDDTWHHVAFTFADDGTPDVQDVQLYLDGVADPLSASLGRAINTLNLNNVDVGNDAFNARFIGAMDELRLYNYALTPAEIAALAMPSASGLISDYAFDGNLEDLGSNGIALEATYGSPVFGPDRYDNPGRSWISPESAGEYLKIANYPGVTGNTRRTVMAWIKPEAGGTRKTILSWGENTTGRMFNLMVAGGNVRVEGGACNVSSTSVDLEDGQWHHIAYTFDPADGGTILDGKIYIDGVLENTTTNYQGNTALNTSGTEAVRIGNSIYRDDYYFLGALEDVRIYDYVVSAEEIADIYCSISQPIEFELSPNALVYYGYDPQACTTISLLSYEGGYGTPLLEWSTGETTATIEVCPTETTTYSLTLTDAISCRSLTKEVIVFVEDVRCGQLMDKVLVCHKGKNILCIAAEDVPDHLGHGDALGRGNCPAAKLDVEFSLEGSPVRVLGQTNVLLIRADFEMEGQAVIYAPDGRLLEKLNWSAGETASQYLIPGIYIVQIRSASGISTFKVWVSGG